MIDRPTPNPPPTGYVEGLSSFLFEPLKLVLKQRFEQSGRFDHVSAMFTYVVDPEYDDWYPYIQFHIPGHTGEAYGLGGKNQKLMLAIEIYYYAKHLQEVGYSANEISHFIECAINIIMSNKQIYLPSGVCIKINGVLGSEVDYYVNGSYLISMGMITVEAWAPDCVIPSSDEEV